MSDGDHGADLLGRVRVVLVEPSHPGNIGAAARAMKVMGLRRLSLVAPARFPSAEATARAAGADDVLYDALVADTLDQAIADCRWVAATSARPRRLGWPDLDGRACGERAVAEARRGEVALVFGRERTGLSNAELDLCNALVCLPTDPGFCSLNLAAAVQLVAYELYKSARTAVAAPAARPEPDSPAATVEELEGLYAHLESTLVDVGYLDPAAPRLLMRRLRRLVNRAAPDHAEVSILRGVLADLGRRLGGG